MDLWGYVLNLSDVIPDLHVRIAGMFILGARPNPFRSSFFRRQPLWPRRPDSC